MLILLMLGRKSNGKRYEQYIIEDLTYKQMKEILGCTDGNMTTHTKKLIQEGFMEVRKEFVNNRPQTTYHLTDEGRTQFEEYVALLNKLVEKGKNAQKV